jgi:dTDP-glucose pyrophosphorylase
MNYPAIRSAAILAGGRGTRMGVLGQLYPKAVLPVCNLPLIHRQLRIVSECGIEEAVVLVGHRAEMVQRSVARAKHLPLRIRFVKQKQMTGAAQGLLELRPHLHSPFLLLLGDVFLVPRRLPRMFSIFAGQGAAGVLATRFEQDPEAVRSNFSVTVTGCGRVTRVIEKPAAPAAACKGVGIYVFGAEIFDAIERTPASPPRGERELTDAIQVMIDSGRVVMAADVVADDVNLNSAAELLKANLAMLRHLKQDNLIARDSLIGPGVRLRSCVVGASAAITGRADLRNCVVFDGAEVDGPGALSNAVITPETTACCGPVTALSAWAAAGQ